MEGQPADHQLGVAIGMLRELPGDGSVLIDRHEAVTVLENIRRQHQQEIAGMTLIASRLIRVLEV